MIPLRQTVLPDAQSLMPYLQEIDTNLNYSNFGPLSRRLEAAIAAHLGVEPEHVVTVANGTTGLVLSLQALGVERDQLCLMPSFTFVASPGAAVAAGMTPYFVDINEDSGVIDPEDIVHLVKSTQEPIGAIMPVSPMGVPVEPEPWEAVAEKIGVPTVVDAAWGFDSAKVSRNPTVISLHATKVLGIGEGGVVACLDKSLIREIRSLANFGFDGSRESLKPAANSKMSEYAAAVGLAAMDQWAKTKKMIVSVALTYREAFLDIKGVRLFPDYSDQWAGAAIAAILDEPIAGQLIKPMANRGIEVRQWWGVPCHHHPAYNTFPRGNLEVTEALSERILNLPFSPGLSPKDVHAVRQALLESMAEARGN